MYYTSKHHMIALFVEMSDIFINLDRLRLKKSLSGLFFKIFSCAQGCKIVGKPFLPFMQPSKQGSVYKNFSLLLWWRIY